MSQIRYSTIRERMDGPFDMSLTGRDANVVMKAVNQGIDAHLEACYAPDRGDFYDWEGHRLNCVISKESLPTLLRRLSELQDGDEQRTNEDEYNEEDDEDRIDAEDVEVAERLVSDILSVIGFSEDEAYSGCYTIAPDSEVDRAEAEVDQGTEAD